MESVPSQNISAATAALTGIREFAVIDSWRWHPSISKWVLKCLLRIASANPDLVPSSTHWYIMIDDAYPNGDVDFNPAKDNSITVTFQHQFYNDVGSEGVPWREGRICSKTDLFYMRKRKYDFEPFDARERLKWHVKRTLSWLCDASKDILVDPGDPFELPDYNSKHSQFTVAHFESSETLGIWSNRVGESGLVHLGMLHRPQNTLIALSFNDVDNKVILEPRWNRYIRGQVERISIGTWALLPEIVVLRPWQSPMTWRELEQLVRQQGVDFSRLLARLMWPFTWDSPQFVLLGFTIPAEWAGANLQVHWQALRFPMLSSTESSEHTRLHWQKSENWHPSQIHNRGMFGATVAEARILVIGAGAIGSMVSEMLVRGGARNLTIIDDGKTEIGNLTRHTLSLNDVAKFKASALGAHISTLSPHVKAEAINTKFENVQQPNANRVREQDIVIDTTGNDDVLFHLENFQWSGSPFFCSIAIGLQARRLYVLIARKPRFPRAFFMRHIKKWLVKDKLEYDGSPLPRSGGIGCWHPAFPARVDDMWLFTSVAVKYMERHIPTDRRYTKLAVFEKVFDNLSFGGIRLVREESDNG